jgi:LacI family transcriptional regulator
MKDVAQLAGVSIGTVSNVLNRPEAVSDKTRHRVLTAISELGFVRNESARQLRAGSSRFLAYVVMDAGNPFFTDVARGVEEAARAAGFAVYLCNSDEDADRQNEYLALLHQQRVHGVLITPVGPVDHRLELLRSVGIPVVLVDRVVDDTVCCSVSVDDVEGGALAVTHLVEQGHRQIAFVGGPLGVNQVQDRLRGARSALEAAGLPDTSLFVLETTALNVNEGRRAGERLAGLPQARRPTAAFCANDLLALGLLQEMTQLGLAVPDEVAIVGYDDIDFAAAAAVPLTSVRQPTSRPGPHRRRAAPRRGRRRADPPAPPGALPTRARRTSLVPVRCPGPDAEVNGPGPTHPARSRALRQEAAARRRRRHHGRRSLEA